MTSDNLGFPKPRHGSCAYFSAAFGRILEVGWTNFRPPSRFGHAAIRSLNVPALLAILAAALSACTVGPDFTPPAAPSTTGYISPGEAPVREAAAGPVAAPQTVALGESVTAEWWTLFRSPEIDALVKEAIAGSPTLESATARLTQAQESVAAASGALYPQVNFSASVAREKLNPSSFGLQPDNVSLPPKEWPQT